MLLLRGLRDVVTMVVVVVVMVLLRRVLVVVGLLVILLLGVLLHGLLPLQLRRQVRQLRGWCLRRAVFLRRELVHWLLRRGVRSQVVLGRARLRVLQLLLVLRRRQLDLMRRLVEWRSRRLLRRRRLLVGRRCLGARLPLRALRPTRLAHALSPARRRCRLGRLLGLRLWSRGRWSLRRRSFRRSVGALGRR